MRRATVALAVLAVAAGAVIAWIYVTTNLDAGSGRGWRLLTAAPHFAPARFLDFPETRPGLVADPDDLAALWEEIHSFDTAPEVDLGRTLVVWAVAIGSGSCPNHLDSVEIGADVVITATPGFAVACTADAVPYTYVVAVDRDVLPAVPFKIRVVTDSAAGSLRVDELPG